MKKEIILCNRCGKQAKGDSFAHLFVTTGRSMDASGNGYEDDGDYVDACAGCLQVWLRKELKDADYMKAKQFLDFMNQDNR